MAQIQAQHDSFKAGDYIEVSAAKGADDFGTIRGTSRDDVGQSGSAYFDMFVESGGVAQNLRFSVNYVNVKLLFSADFARNLGKG